jgi:hypothetical protein
LGGWDPEDWGLRPAWANSSQDPISKITRAKWTGGVAQAMEYLLCKCKVPWVKPKCQKKIKKYKWNMLGSKRATRVPSMLSTHCILWVEE